MFTLVSGFIFIYLSIAIIRSLAPYNEQTKFKYISLKSKFLAKILIPKANGYTKVKDRKKISLYSMISYIVLAIVLVTLVSMFFIPDIPCEPFTARFGKGARMIRWTIASWNEKILYSLPIMYSLAQIISYFLLGIPSLIKRIKENEESAKALISIIALIVLLLALMMLFIWLFLLK